MLRIYIIGLAILLIAIFANVIVAKLGLSTWYDFGPRFFSNGFSEIKEVGLLNFFGYLFYIHWCLLLDIL